MENRLELLRQHIDEVLLRMTDTEERRCAYLHLYGVAQSCALIALKRGENVELATMAGMLHDFYSYKYMDTQNHGAKGAVLAREVLGELNVTTPNETEMICVAIHNHSDKACEFDPFTEVLIDADTLQHYLYNCSFTFNEHRQARLKKLAAEFGFAIQED